MVHGGEALAKATEVLPAAPPERRPWRTLARVAAAVPLFLAGTIAVFPRDDQPHRPQVAPKARASAEEIARGFLDAYSSFDAERAMTFLTRRALDAEWGTPAKLRLQLRFLQATGWRQTILDPYTVAHAGDVPPPPPGSDGCEVYDFATGDNEKAAPGRLTVHCQYTYFGLRSDEIGRGPYYDSYWAIVVDKGRIASVENRKPRRQLDMFDLQVGRPFRRWVSAAYPHDAAAMYQDADRSAWKRTEASIRLWDQHTREYVAAGVPYIARADAICAAAHDRLEATFGPLPTGSVDANLDAYEAYRAATARVLEDALAELRAVPPPDAFRAEWESAYALGDRVVRDLRGETTVSQDELHVFGSQPGLHQCYPGVLGG